MINTECQNPSCSNDSEETYHGKNDNTIRLCERCYYNLVTETINTGNSEPLTPFWDSGIRCDNTTSDWNDDPIQDAVSEYMQKAQRRASRKKGGPL